MADEKKTVAAKAEEIIEEAPKAVKTAAEKVTKNTKKVADDTKKVVEKAVEDTKKATKKVADDAKKVTKKATDDAKKVTKKATTATKKATTATKKAVEKKKLASITDISNCYFEYNGKQVHGREILEEVEKKYLAEGHRISSIKSINIYVKAEDNAAYYVINDKITGKVDI